MAKQHYARHRISRFTTQEKIGGLRPRVVQAIDRPEQSSDAPRRSKKSSKS